MTKNKDLLQTPASLKTVGYDLSKKPSMANMDLRGDPSSSDLGIDWTWLLEPLPPMLQETHVVNAEIPCCYILEELQSLSLRTAESQTDAWSNCQFPWQNTTCFSLLCENLNPTGRLQVSQFQSKRVPCQFREITLPGALMHGGREPNGRTPIMAAR